jgi:hypothetical protein
VLGMCLIKKTIGRPPDTTTLVGHPNALSSPASCS